MFQKEKDKNIIKKWKIKSENVAMRVAVTTRASLKLQRYYAQTLNELSST